MPFALKVSYVFVLVALLTACSTRLNRELPLLEPGSWACEAQLTQKVIMRQGQKSWQNSVTLALSPIDITMVSLTPLGQRLFTAQYRQGQALRVTTLVDGQEVPAQHILALMQLALWPAASLKQIYHGNWQFETIKQKRFVYREAEMVIDIALDDMRPISSAACNVRVAESSDQMWPFRVHILDSLSGMEITVETLEFQAL
jgi:hypothetical protein